MRLQVIASLKQPACILTSVNAGTGAKLVIDQPEDLELDVFAEAASERRIDGFEFGPESASLERPGDYRVEVRLHRGSGAVPVRFSVSREEIPLGEATLRARAENQATLSKRTQTPEDIASALVLWQQLADAFAVARTQLAYGDRRLAVGNASEARDLYEEALKFCASFRDNRCIAEAANNSGLASQQIGDFPLALSRLRQAAEAWKKESKPIFQGRTLSNLGLLFRRTGDFQQAIANYSQAKQILQRTEDVVSYARVLNNLGLCFTSLTEYEKALSYLNSALAVYATHKSPRDSVRTRLNLGRTYMLAGQLRRANLTLKQALREAADDQSARADVLNNLGQLAWRERAYDEGRESLSEALALARSLHDRRGEASALHYMGLLTETAGDNRKAAEYLSEAANIREVIGLRDDAAESFYRLAKLRYAIGDRAGAKEYSEHSLGLLESVRRQAPTPALRAAFYSGRRGVFDLLLEIQLSSGNPSATEDGLVEAERGKARALLDLLAEGSILRQVSPDYVERRAAIQRQVDLLLVQLSSAQSGQQAAIRSRLDLLFAEDAERETQVRQKLAEQKLGTPLASLAELHRYLPSDTALLEFYLGANRGYLWLVDANTTQVFSLPGNDVIEPVIARTMDLFERVNDRQRDGAQQTVFERGMRQLSTILLGPLKNVRLPKRLIIVPDGAAYRVPFAALWLPGKSIRAGLVYELLQAPSAGYLTAGRRPRPSQEFAQAILALRDPVFSIDDPRVESSRPANQPPEVSLSRLPYRTEIDVIEKLTPDTQRTILSAFNASIFQLRQQQLDRYGVIYFSAHAIIDDRQPELSRIVLSRVDPKGRPVAGFLRPDHLAGLRLDGTMVILSACETALGKRVSGEGLTGFASSLFAAGAAQLVLSLDKVDAEASSQFFANTFESYLAPSGPQSIERSMLLSRKAMAASSRWADPFYWGSFVVVGRPSDAAKAPNAGR